MGTSLPLNGLMAYPPVKMPRFSNEISVDWRSSFRLLADALDEGRNLFAPFGRSNGGDQRVFRRQDHESHPERRVRPGREHLDLVVGTGHADLELGALRAPDPVALHRLDPLGPFQCFQSSQ